MASASPPPVVASSATEEDPASSASSPPPPPSWNLKDLPRLLHARDDATANLVVIPRGKLSHWPAGADFSALPPICRPFLATGDCPRGVECDAVHAYGTGIKRRPDAHIGPHADPNWKPNAGHPVPEKTELPTPAQQIVVAFPSPSPTAARSPTAVAPAAGEMIDRTALLPTRGASRKPPVHCAHYLRRRMCLLGAQCQFVHPSAPSREALEWAAAHPAKGFSLAGEATSDTNNSTDGKRRKPQAAVATAAVATARAGANGSGATRVPHAQPSAPPPHKHRPYHAQPIAGGSAALQHRTAASSSAAVRHLASLPASIPTPDAVDETARHAPPPP